MSMLMLATDLTWARSQMAFTLGTHIVLACLGVGFPAIMLIANWLGVRRGDADALLLARRWSKVVAVTFAVGVVTGTVLSFEFGILWPGLFDRFGEVIGLPFAIEGIFFFLEAIFIGIYLYGWDRLSPRAHLASGVPIVISGIGGAAAVVSANAWMNQPGGFELDAAGRVTDVDPLRVMFNHATPYEVPHMILAAYMVAGFLAASVYAVGMLRGRRDRYHRLGLAIPFTVAALATPVQLFVGDVAARAIMHDQPSKYASMAYVTKTSTHVPEYLFGVYDASTGDVSAGVRIPDLNSLLAGFSPNTEVIGLDQVPPDERPPSPTLLHWCFDVMVGIGTALLVLCAWFGWSMWRRRGPPTSRWFLRAAAVSGVAAVVALESGWILTEVGRQPWIVYGVMRTADAVTDAGGVAVSFWAIVAGYGVLFTTAILVVRGMTRRWRVGEDVAVPYSPEAAERPS
ncbi:MAG: cytochrome bd ubiquinol oxidase subunit [Solirubrobacteraceae bacterium]|jgi:cytochrome d ubiquinol oxidase subunit I|nr:cytochrome bd ubiquinol oxidase subunit [Solirubrobacteraceae bacterium]